MAVFDGERLESKVQVEAWSVDLKQRTLATSGGLLMTPMASAHAVPSEVQSTAGSLWKKSPAKVGSWEFDRLRPYLATRTLPVLSSNRYTRQRADLN